MATEADRPELIHEVETEKSKDLGCSQVDKILLKVELQKVEDEQTLVPELIQSSAEAEEPRVIQYAKDEHSNPTNEGKVGISEGEVFLESPSVAKAAVQDISQVSENSSNKETTKLKEKDTLKNEKLQEHQTNESAEVKQSPTEANNKADDFSEEVPVDKNWEDEKKDKQPVKSSESFTEEKPDESVEVTDGLTEGEKVDESVEVTDGFTKGEKFDTFDKQVPLENVEPDEQLEKSTEPSTESLIEEKEIGHFRTDLSSSPIPTALDFTNLQELENLNGQNEGSEVEKQKVTEFLNDEQAATEENMQKGKITNPHLHNDEPMLEALPVSKHIEEGKAVNNVQKHEMDRKKSCEDLNVEAKNETQRVEATLGRISDDRSPETDMIVGEESEIMEKSVKLESCIKEESIGNKLGIKHETIDLNASEIKLNASQINVKEEELERKRQDSSFDLADTKKGLETMSKTEDKKTEGNENPQDTYGHASAEASTNIHNGKAEKIENDESTSENLDTLVTMQMEENGHDRDETEESGTREYSGIYSLDQRSREITEKEINHEGSLENETQDENNNTGNSEKNESKVDQDAVNSQQREKPVLAKLEMSTEAMTVAPDTTILCSNEKAEAYNQDYNPAENLEKSFEGVQGVQSNYCIDSREDGVQKEENSNQDDKIDKIEWREVENLKKCTDDMPLGEEEECKKHENISEREVKEEIVEDNGKEEKEHHVESAEVSKTQSTANIEDDKEGTSAMKLIQTIEEVSEGLEIASADKETSKQKIEEEVATGFFQKSTREETVDEHSQEVVVSETFDVGHESKPTEKQVIEDVAASGNSNIYTEEEAVIGNSKDDEIMSYKVPERLDRNTSGKEAEKEVKDGAVTDLSTVLPEKETSNESSQEDEKEAKKSEEVKKPEEASKEIIFDEATHSTESTGKMTLIDEEKAYNNDNVSNVSNVDEKREETTQKEESEKLTNTSFLVSEISEEQNKEHILDSDQNTNDKSDPACTTTTIEQTSLQQEDAGKAAEEAKHDVSDSTSVTVPETKDQAIETIIDSETTHTKILAKKAEGKSLEASALLSKEQELKFTKENETLKGVTLLEDGPIEQHRETPSIEQLEEELSVLKEKPANLDEGNKMGGKDNKENPKKEFQKTGESFQNIETVNDVSAESSQENISEVKNIRDVSFVPEGHAPNASVEDNSCLKEKGPFGNLEESLEEGRKGDEGKHTDATSETETQRDEVIVFPDEVTMEQNLKDSELSKEIESTILKNQAGNLSISHIPVEETVKAEIEKHEKVSDIRPKEDIHREDEGPPEMEEHTLEITEMSRTTETVNTDHGRTAEEMISEFIQTSDTECMELTIINELDSKDKLKDTNTDENTEDMKRSKEQTAKRDLHEQGTEDNCSEEGVVEEDSSIKDHNNVVLTHETVESPNIFEKDQNIVEKPVDELQEKDHMCETTDAEFNKMNAIQKQEEGDKIIKASENIDYTKVEICAVRDIPIISIEGKTIFESPEEDKEEELNPMREVTEALEVTGPCTEVHESLEMTGPSTDIEQETLKDDKTIKDHSELQTGEEAVMQTYMEDEKEVKNQDKEFHCEASAPPTIQVSAKPETAGFGDVIAKQIAEEDDTVKAQCSLSIGQETINKHPQEDEKEEMKPKIEVFQELEKTGFDKNTSQETIECDDATESFMAFIAEEAIKTRSEKEEGQEQIEAANDHEPHEKQSLKVDPTVEDHREGEPEAKHNSLEDEVNERCKLTSEGQETGRQRLDDEAIIDFKKTLDQTSIKKPKEDDEAKKQREVKEYELPTMKDFKVTDTTEEKDKLMTNDGEASNENFSAFTTAMPLGEEIIQKESSQKFSDYEEYLKEEILEKADNTSKACPSADDTITTEKLNLQVSETEGQEQIEVSMPAPYETSSAPKEASETVSARQHSDAMKPEETLNLDAQITSETPISRKSDAYKDEEEKLPDGASKQDQKIAATSGIGIKDSNLYFNDKSEKVQESSTQVSENQELRSINRYSEIKDVTILKHEIQDEKQETHSAVQIKEEITMQAEEPRILKDGLSEGTEKESLLPDSDLEEHISKPKDKHAVSDLEITAEPNDISQDRQLNDSSKSIEKKQLGDQLDLNHLSKETEKGDTCNSNEKDNQESVYDHTKSHGLNFANEKDEQNDIEFIAEAQTKDHGSESSDTAVQNFEASVIGKKPNSCIESVNEEHEQFSITKEVGKIIKDSGAAPVEFQNEARESKTLNETKPDLQVEDRMIIDACQKTEGCEVVFEGIEKVHETVMIEEQNMAEGRNAKHWVEDEKSNEESSLLASRKVGLGSIDMNRETPLEPVIQDEKLETASTAHIKEEITMQSEMSRKLPESDHEDLISKSKDMDAGSEIEKTVEPTDFIKDRQSDNSSQSLEKNQPESERDLHQLSEEIKKADACANNKKDTHDLGLKDEKDESNNVEYMAEAETRDHGCESCPTTITTSITKNEDGSAQNVEASVVGEKPKSHVISVAEDQHHEKLSITEELGRNIKEPSYFEDKMSSQRFQNEASDNKNLDDTGPVLEAEDRIINDAHQHTKHHILVSEGSKKASEYEMVKRDIIEEVKNDKQLVEDETSNGVKSSDLSPLVRNFEVTNATKKKEIDVQGEEQLKTKAEASPVAEISEQDTLREEDLEKLPQLSCSVSKSSEGKDIEDYNVYKHDLISVMKVAKETNLEEAEPKVETISEASGVDYEKINVETCEAVESGTRGEKNESLKLQISTSVSQVPKFGEKTDQEDLIVETMDKDDVHTTVGRQKDTQKKEDQIKNIDKVRDGGCKADELSFCGITENESSKDEHAEAVNLGASMKIKHRESQDMFANEVPIYNSLPEGNLVGDAETKCEEAPNQEPEKLQGALYSVSQLHLQALGVIAKDIGNEEGESIIKVYDTLTDSNAGDSFQDEKLDKQLREEEPTAEAEENQKEIIDEVNKNIQNKTVTDEVSSDLESAITKGHTAQEISEGKEDVKDPSLILGVERVNECNEEDKNIGGDKVAGEPSKMEPGEKIHEREVDKAQKKKTHEAKDFISHEEVQREPEKTSAKEIIEQQITVGEESVRDSYSVPVEEEKAQKTHQEDKMTNEEEKITPAELKPDETSAKLESDEDMDMKVNDTIIQDKENINKEIKEVSKGLETAGASEKITMPIAEEKEASQDPYPMHVQDQKVHEIQKEDFLTPDVEDKEPKLNSEYHNRDKSNDNTEKEEIDSSGPVAEVQELQTTGFICEVEILTVKDDEEVIDKLDDAPNSNSSSEEVTVEISKDYEELSQIMHEEPINENIIRKEPLTERTSEDKNAPKDGIELEKIKNASDVECGSTGKTEDLHSEAEIPISSPDASFPTENKQEKMPEIEGNLMESNERQNLGFGWKEAAEVIPTAEAREDNSKVEAPVEETFQNEASTRDTKYEEQQNQITEQEETPRNNELLKEPSDPTDEQQTTRTTDFAKVTDTKISTGTTGTPLKPGDTIENSSKKAEVEDKVPAEESKNEFQVKGLDCQGDRRAQDERDQSVTESKPSDPDKFSSSDLLQKSTKETIKIVEAEEPTPKHEETENMETPMMPQEEQKAREEEKDEDGEDEDDEHNKATDSGSDAPVMVDASRDIDMKPPHKKSHNLLSGMRTKVRHSIAKVKKVITGSSSHNKSSSPK